MKQSNVCVDTDSELYLHYGELRSALIRPSC